MLKELDNVVYTDSIATHALSVVVNDYVVAMHDEAVATSTDISEVIDATPFDVWTIAEDLTGPYQLLPEPSVLTTNFEKQSAAKSKFRYDIDALLEVVDNLETTGYNKRKVIEALNSAYSHFETQAAVEWPLT